MLPTAQEGTLKSLVKIWPSLLIVPYGGSGQSRLPLRMFMDKVELVKCDSNSHPGSWYKSYEALSPESPPRMWALPVSAEWNNDKVAAIKWR